MSDGEINNWRGWQMTDFNIIPDQTPITYHGVVVGHTVGEQEVGKPVNCVLYPNIDLLQYLNTGKLASLEVSFVGAE